MTNKRIIFTLLIGGLTYLLAILGGVFFAYSPKTRLQIVDESNGKPVAGANAVLMWRLTGGMEGGTKHGPFKVLETVSDQQGRLVFPSWGPRFIAKGTIGFQEPILLVLHKDYKPEVIYSDFFQDRWVPWSRAFMANAKGMVTLSTSAGSADIRARDLARQLNSLETPLNEKYPCYIKKIPKMLSAWHAEIMNMPQLVGNSFPVPDDPYRFLGDSYCGANAYGELQ